MRFDLTDLKLFLHVVEAGSITAGADRMHLAVAAASTRIRNMEIELGTALLNRDRQGVQPTPTPDYANTQVPPPETPAPRAEPATATSAGIWSTRWSARRWC